jgi:hypothetical protein
MSEHFSVSLGGFFEYSISTSYGQTLHGNGELHGGFQLLSGGTVCRVDNLEVYVEPLLANERNRLLVTRVGDQQQAALHCHVDSLWFLALKEPPAKDIVISFSLPNGPYRIDQGRFEAVPEQLEITIRERRRVDFGEVRATSIWSAASRYSAQFGSQIHEIAVELLRSYQELALSSAGLLARRDEYFERVRTIIAALRSAVPRSREGADWMDSDIDDFLEGLRDADAELAGRRKLAYDTVWEHRPAAHCLVRDPAQPADSTALGRGQLEEAATVYLDSGLSAPSLEHLLIDALLFAEVIEFAGLLGALPMAALPGELLRRLRPMSGALVSATIALALALFATGLDQGERATVFLLVLAAMTLLRWLRPSEARTAAQRDRRLLQDMSGVQKRTCQPEFNPRLVRELLYGLERRGAAFSRLVYDLLDRRIAREGSEQAS